MLDHLMKPVSVDEKEVSYRIACGTQHTLQAMKRGMCVRTKRVVPLVYTEVKPVRKPVIKPLSVRYVELY